VHEAADVMSLAHETAQPSRKSGRLMQLRNHRSLGLRHSGASQIWAAFGRSSRLRF
jgi:hypothetical protein